MGDFNAKSPQWGMGRTDNRGQVMTEWIAEQDLLIVNEGNKPTFERHNSSSIIDLTMATEDVRGKITKWEVSDKETMSFHKYVIFEVAEKRRGETDRGKARGWNLKKLDRQKLQSTLEDIVEDENTITAEGFSKTLTTICNATMPNKKYVRRGPPAYWWNDEIAELRKECINKRRLYTRSVRRIGLEQSIPLWEEYKETKKMLKNNIKKTKRDCWKSICDEIDCDIWGNGYKIAKKRLIGFPPRHEMSMKTVDEVVKHLFPVHESVIFNQDTNVTFTKFTESELEAACGRLKNNKAPGPKNIPAEIIKHLATNKPEYVLRVYNDLATSGQFPIDWKRAKLVLLRKGDKPIEEPSSHRPICLLDAEGKLFEQLILPRIKKEMTRVGGLADTQYGFREGRQTVDAIKEVVRIANEAAAYAHRQRRLCAVITLDIRNAFNSASWQIILDELKRRQIDGSLINLIASYLSQREIILEAENQTKVIETSSGVPQGSVMGPTLWNVLYNNLLELEQPEGVKLIGFADDIAMVVTARNEDLLMSTTNIAIVRIANWLHDNKLQLAPEKTEAVLLTTKRKISAIQFNVLGTELSPTTAIKYLGVWLDTKLTFAEHINRTVQKAEKTMTAILSLMPNIGGPRASKRRILISVVQSQLLYAAPVWHKITENQKLLRRFTRLQRIMCIRVCSGYRTISADAADVIAGVPPIELLIKERVETYNGAERKVARENTMARWQQKWDSASHGRWTARLIPNIGTWIKRPYGEVDYFLTQALSGHGCFEKYLYEKGKRDSDSCKYCQGMDDAEHTLFYCSRWTECREEYHRATTKEFNIENMMEDLKTSEETWKQTYNVIRKIIANKEQEERMERA